MVPRAAFQHIVSKGVDVLLAEGTSEDSELTEEFEEMDSGRGDSRKRSRPGETPFAPNPKPRLLAYVGDEVINLRDTSARGTVRTRGDYEGETAVDAIKKRMLDKVHHPKVVIRKPKLARYSSVFAKFTKAKKKDYRNRKAKWRVPLKHEYYRKNFSRGIESSGDKRIRELRDALSQLDQLGFMRSSHQREFHEAFIGACLPQIYGEDFDRNLVKILRENNMDEIRCEIMVCCPRRWGKTMAVALYAAAYLWTQPEAEIIIYSIAKRTSSMMSSKIYNMIVKLAGGDHCVGTHKQEDLVITNMNGGESVLHSYPAASRISILFIVIVCPSHEKVHGWGVFFPFVSLRHTEHAKNRKRKKKKKK